MEMTENMKRSMLEALQKSGLELSEEQLEDVTGGRGMTRRERDSFWSAFRPFMQFESARWDKALGFDESDKRIRGIVGQYFDYIESLPEGSPEVLFEDTELCKKLWKFPGGTR